MRDITGYIAIFRAGLLLLIVVLLLLKLILYYKYEREWNSITFFYFNKIQLKLTTSRSLRKLRKNQNLLTRLFCFLLAILLATSLFYGLVGS